MDHTVNKDDFEGWLKEPIWVVYSLNTKIQKKMYVAVGQQGFLVTHGREIVYEGPYMTNAVEAYNDITSPPNPNEAPKLDN